MRWLAICGSSDMAHRRHRMPPEPMPDLLVAGTMVIELALPAAPDRPLDILNFAETRGWARGLRLRLYPDGSLRLGQRQGPAQAGVALRIDVPRGMHGLRITYAWNAPARRSRLSAEILHGGVRVVAQGTNPLPVPAEDARMLFAAEGRRARHAAVVWMGLSSDEIDPRLGAAVASATPIRTPAGQVRADRLRAGDLVTTRDNGPRPLRVAARVVLPAQGSFTPIRLRSPYFPNTQDVIVSPGTRLLLSGAEVEYLLGEDEVLVAARQMVNNRSVLYETRRLFVEYTLLLFDRTEVILAADCPVESHAPAEAGPAGNAPPRRRLQSYEAVTLQGLIETRHIDRAA